MAPISTYTFSSFASSGATLMEVFALNDRGQLVGAYEVSGRDHGFVENGGALTSIDYQSATDTCAFGIINAGVIVGFFDGASPSSGTGASGFTLTCNQYTSIAVPCAARTEARGFNDAGVIVGDCLTALSKLKSGFIDREGSFRTFAVPGTASTIPYQINSSGSQVVGFYQNADEDNVHDFSCDIASNAFTFTDHSGATSTDVFGLNDAGGLSGGYVDATGSHAFTTDCGVSYQFSCGDSDWSPTRAPMNGRHKILGTLAGRQTGGAAVMSVGSVVVSGDIRSNLYVFQSASHTLRGRGG